MKRVMLMMVLAALLLTQCKKPSIDFPTPSVTTTVSMTITAGPGSKTDITTAGGIVWSENDKIYVGDGAKCIGSLSIVSGVSNATGTFTGEVTATAGDDCTFHFYYLGSATNVDVNATEVTVDFSNQNIYADNGKLKNASGQHVGYGKVEGVDVEADTPITGIQVDMKSKVAIAYFCFVSGTETPDPYRGALTLSGEHIYNKMTVNFNASDFYFTPVKDGDISLTNTTTNLKYAMLVPTGSTAEETLNFGGGGTGSTTLANGIEANKFYRVDGSMPIVVTVTKPKFSVDQYGTTVEFSPGNLQYLGQAEEGHKWRFAEHQWDYMGDGPNTTTGNKGNVDLGTVYAGKYNTGSGTAGPNETNADKEAARDLFGWGCTGYQDTRTSSTDYQKNYRPYSTSNSKVNTTYNYYGYGPDYVSSPYYNLTVENQSDWGCNTIYTHYGDATGSGWRTLTSEEWKYLISTRTVNGGTGEGKSYQRATINSDATGVYGMLLYPDGYTSQTGATTYTAEQFKTMEQAGVVFLPAAGHRNKASLDNVGSYGRYWSSSCYSSIYYAYRIQFNSFIVNPLGNCNRYLGCTVRLVR